MKSQLLKGVTMLVAIIALAFVTALVSSAQSRSRQLTADIPFDFVVGERTLAAGNYAVGTASTASSEAVVIRSSDGRQKAMRLTKSVSDNAAARRARLVFHRYGNTYFLTQVWAAGASEGREMLKTRQERSESELAKNAAGTESARSGGPEVVTIVAEMK